MKKYISIVGTSVGLSAIVSAFAMAFGALERHQLVYLFIPLCCLLAAHTSFYVQKLCSCGELKE